MANGVREAIENNERLARRIQAFMTVEQENLVGKTDIQYEETRT